MHDKLSVLGADLLKETLPSIIEEQIKVYLEINSKQHLLPIFDAKMSELAE